MSKYTSKIFVRFLSFPVLSLRAVVGINSSSYIGAVASSNLTCLGQEHSCTASIFSVSQFSVSVLWSELIPINIGVH